MVILTLSMELTTRCNQRCDFCTHRLGRRAKKDVPLEVAKARIDEVAHRFPAITSFVPVGLGEPLLYPHLIEVLEYAREALPWAKLTLNTNGTLDMTPLIGKLDILTVSICFARKEEHDKRCGVPSYDSIVKNTTALLEKKEGLPQVTLHIFDTCNRREWFLFKLRWYGCLNWGDACHKYPYLDLVNNPCPKEGQQDNLMVDVDGNIYNSCMGVWYPPEGTAHLLVGKLLS